ncbi:MAG: DMT family transporter [Gammaproteobacteria bacterium]|nr:DMT family transporter [Gammaproteobacteria bacterium]MBT6552691.1 DMT family transporter [Gammaproteobacteria bacterium]
MSITAAYLTVIIIWSTTPLAIQWSSAGVGYEFGVALRMVIGLSVLLLIVKLWRQPLPWNKHNLRIYLSGGIPLFIAMSSVYWSAQFIPSGWISVIFGLTPLFTSLFASLILGEKSFTTGKTIGMLLGLAGLAIVFMESINFEQAAWWGVAGVSISSLVHSLSTVLLKKLNPTIPAISITTGSLIVATPLFVLNSLFHGLPQDIPTQSLSAIVYLAIMGSALGFPLYFYCLKKLHAQRVALITFITPVTALLLGNWLNHELISQQIWLGTACILAGLAIYEYGKYLPWKKGWVRWIRNPL